MLYLQPAVALPQCCIAPAEPQVSVPAHACVRQESLSEHTQGPTGVDQMQGNLPFQVKGCYRLVRDYEDLIPWDVLLYHRAIVKYP